MNEYFWLRTKRKVIFLIEMFDDSISYLREKGEK